MDGMNRVDWHGRIRTAWAVILESRTLAALHDALLPKLLSGELRLKGLEKLVEKTA
jgi:hypothetical protein